MNTISSEEKLDNFETKGFLSSEIESVIQQVHQEYGHWINLFKEISDYAVSIQQKIEIIPNNNAQSLLAATLFARTLANCQGAYLLIERGMDTQAKILLRAAIESLFVFAAICKSEKTAQEFIDSNEPARKKILNKVLNWESAPLKKMVKKGDLEKKREEIDNTIKERNAKPYYAEQMSIKADLHDLYLTAYTVFSGSVHSSVRDLEKHLILDDNGIIKGFCNAPVIDGLDSLLLTASETILRALNPLGNLFKMDLGNFYSEKYYALRKLKEGTKGL
jgi:hypothetical protein